MGRPKVLKVIVEKIKLNTFAIKAGIKLAKLITAAIADREVTEQELVRIKIAGDAFLNCFVVSEQIAKAAEAHQADNA